MFTTGSKFFIGGTVLAIVAAVVYGATTGGQAGWTGTVGLISAAVAFAILGSINYFSRDGNVSGVQQGGGANTPAAQAPAANTFWPLILAVGAVLIAVGADTHPAFFKLGVVVVIAGLAEWLLQAWSDRASADAQYNSSVRRRMAYPLELPIIGAIATAILAFSFSRIMLWIDKAAGPLLFVVFGAIVLVAGFLIAARPKVSKGLVGGLGAVLALGVVGVGVAAALDGERKIPHYPTTAEEEFAEAICSSPGEFEGEGEFADEVREIDERSQQNVSMISNLAATVILEDGQLKAYPIGLNESRTSVTIARDNPTSIRFRNLDAEHHRFTVHLGSFENVETDSIDEHVVCTGLIDEDSEGFLTLRIPKSSAQSLEPYRIEVPGVEGAEIEVVVP
jgi:hypothetical protein